MNAKERAWCHVSDEYLSYTRVHHSWLWSGRPLDRVQGCFSHVWLQVRCHYNDHPQTWMMLLPLPLAAAGIMSRWWVTPWQRCNSITQQQQTQTWRSAVWWSRGETNVLFACLAASSSVWTPFSHQLHWFSTVAACSIHSILMQIWGVKLLTCVRLSPSCLSVSEEQRRCV